MCVFRHADRTPKMKLKFNIKGAWSWSEPFIRLLQGRRDEIILREDEQLRYIETAADEAFAIEGADVEMLNSLKKILNKKIGVSGTKAQLKPSFDKEGHCEKLNIIVKWGGEFTHAGRYQSRDLGENFRKDYAILNKSLLKNATICSSSECVHPIYSVVSSPVANIFPQAPSDCDCRDLWKCNPGSTCYHGRYDFTTSPDHQERPS